MAFKSVAAALAMSVSTLIATGVQATELRLATIVPEKSVWAAQVHRYADRVKELSNGDLTIEVFANAELGNMGDTLKKTLGGRIDMWLGATPVMAAVTPELATMTFPYLFDNADQIKCAVPKLDDEIRGAIGKKYHLIGMFAVGAQNVAMVGEGKLPADLQGKKIRSAPLPSSLAFFQAMGATPQPLSAAETTPALSTGLVEGVDLATVYYVLTGANKVATNLIPTRHVQNLGGLIISAKSWAKLSDEEKEIMTQAADAIPFSALMDEVLGFEAKMEAAHVAGGGTITELSDADRAEWRDTGRSTWDASLAEMGDGAKNFVDAVSNARESCVN